jgi:hypothetical protein
MVRSDEPLCARSLAEAYLYLMVTPCSECGGGSLRGCTAMPVADLAEAAEPYSENRWLIDAVCKACKAESRLTVCIEPSSTGSADDSIVISPTDDPSVILDVGQWVVLFRMIEGAVASEPDKIRARELRLGAAACLDEALKFYDDPENDLPPSESVFCDATAERMRQAPEQFSRQRLLALRSKLPHASGVITRVRADDPRHWWRTIP